MPVIKVRENESFDVALRRFKRSCEKAGILAEVRAREFYEKPTTIRKREKATLAKEGKMAGYLPDVDETLQTKTGICFDYAALMATMLRTQNIPTRMELGYVTMEDETIYHAWISVYIHDIGWIDDLIHFDGKNWSMMDPTLISDGHNSSKVRSLIKDQINYTTKYLY